MVTRALLVGSLVCAVGCFAAEPQIASGQEIVEARTAPAKNGDVLDATNFAVRVQGLALLSPPGTPSKKVAAVVMPQDETITGDSASGKGSLVETVVGGASTYQIELLSGMVYAAVSTSGSAPRDVAEQVGGAPGPAGAEDVGAAPEDPEVAEADRRPLTTGDYPVVKVKSVQAGAEGTELFAAILRLENADGSKSNDAEVVVFHMGGKGSRVWANSPTGTLQQIPFRRRLKVFLSVKISNYFTASTTDDTYGPAEVKRFKDHLDVKGIFDEISRVRREEGRAFFNLERP